MTRVARYVMSLALALSLAAGPAAAQPGGDAPPRIVVSAEGAATAAPDMATLRLGVVAEAGTARAAVDRMSVEAAALLETLEAAGLAGRDVQTSGLSLSPLWRAPDGRDAPREIVGFSAATDVTVRVRRLEELGALLDEVVTAGANTFGGLSFGVAEPAPLRDAARRAAVSEAARKARLLAEAAGVTLGPLLEISEADRGDPRLMRAETAAARGVPIAAGELRFGAQVTLIYAIAR